MYTVIIVCLVVSQNEISNFLNSHYISDIFVNL